MRAQIDCLKPTMPRLSYPAKKSFGAPRPVCDGAVLNWLSIDVNSGRAPTSASSLGERGSLSRTPITISHCSEAEPVTTQ
jgi:hypothetical protein